ncbi:MAG: hypothetical protein Fur0018_11190 [Anaerolineales bacterium]
MSSPQSNAGWRVMLNWLHPWLLVNGTLTYLLGVGVAHYLGIRIDSTQAWLGWLWVFSLLAGAFLLESVWSVNAQVGAPDEVTLARLRAGFAGAFGLLALGATVSVLLFMRAGKSPLWLLMILITGLLFWYAIPPRPTALNGYGEILQAVVGAGLIPAFGFMLQAGTLHRLLAMITFGLPFLYLAAVLACSLETYERDIHRYTLLVRLGWENGLRVHDALVVFALVLMAGALAFGLPWGLSGPFGVALAWGGFQMWYLGRIRQGAPPHWGLLRWTAVALYALPAYLMTFTLWVR